MPTEQPVPHAPTHHHMSAALNLSPAAIKKDLQFADSFNAKVAVVLTKVVGTMWCFWFFNAIAFVSLKAALDNGSLTVLINWVSSNWIQLILLPALMVGQNLQNVAADKRAEQSYNDLEFVKDQVNENTDGGVKAIIDAIAALDVPRKQAAS